MPSPKSKSDLSIAILSTGPKLYSTSRLREAAEQRGHRVKILNTLDFSIVVDTREPSLYYKGTKVEGYHAVIPRIGASITFFGTAVVRQFEQMGVFCLNSSDAINASRDKLRSSQLLSGHDLPIPETAFVKRKTAVLGAIDLVGGAPVVLKLLEGTQGTGVILAEKAKTAEAVVETLQSARQNVLIQHFVEEAKGRDVRAFVVGDRVVASMRRIAKAGEYRSNVHRGGRTEAVELPPEYQRTAVRAAHTLGLRVAGVDVLETAQGPRILEVNSSPGLEGIEGATGVDVAGAIIEAIETEVRHADTDIRERITLQSGFCVMEFSVGSESPLAGKTLRDCRMRENEVVVLSLTRSGKVRWNPAADQDMQVGDRLLCFGRGQTLRGMAPRRTAKRSASASGQAPA